MGGKRMHKVMKSLEAVDVTVPWEPGERKTNKRGVDNSVWHMGIYELMALLTIAYRQRDADDEYPDKDCICIAVEQVMGGIARMAHAKVSLVKKFLLRSGLVTFEESCECKNFDDPNVIQTYTNAWRINDEVLERYAVKAEHIRKHRTRGEGGGSAAGEVEPTTHGVDSNFHGVETDFHGVDTEIKEEITEKDNNNNTGKAGVVVDEMEKAEKLRQYIIDRFHLQPEQDKNINVYSMRKVIANKDIRLVKKVIDGYNKPNGYSRSGDDEIISWIKSMMADVRDTVPTTTDACNQSAADLDALLGAPVKVDAEPVLSEFAKKFRDGWNVLLNDFEMNKLDADRRKELKSAYSKAFAHKSDETAILSIDKFLADLPYERGGTPEAMVKEIPDVVERYNIAIAELKEYWE